MNDLLPMPKSLTKGGAPCYVDLKKDSARDLEMGPGAGGEQQGLHLFFEEVSKVKKEMEKLKELLGRLKMAHEESKRVHSAQQMIEVRKCMDGDVREVLLKARAIKSKLEDLDASNEDMRRLPGCEPGTPSDRTRLSITNSLRKKLKDLMEDYQSLREITRMEYKETVKRRFYAVNGQTPDEETVERIIETGESESYLQKAIQEQGRGPVLDTVKEIQERHDAAMEMEKSLLELHQIFLDMAVMVDGQSEQLNDIEHYVSQANAYIDRGAQQLKSAKHHQRNTRKWTILALIILLLLLLLLIIPLATSFKRS